MDPGKVGASGRLAGPVPGSPVGPERTVVGVPASLPQGSRRALGVVGVGPGRGEAGCARRREPGAARRTVVDRTGGLAGSRRRL